MQISGDCQVDFVAESNREKAIERRQCNTNVSKSKMSTSCQSVESEVAYQFRDLNNYHYVSFDISKMFLFI